MKCTRKIYGIKRFIKDILDGFRNLIFWIPIIWNDFDYDYEPMLRMMKKKLILMELCIRDSFVGSEKEADKIKVCINLLDRIMDDNYSIEQMKKRQKVEDCKYLFDIMGKNILKWWT